MSAEHQPAPARPAKDAAAAAIDYLSSPNDPRTEDIEYLISVLEMESQHEGIEVAHSISFEAVGLGIIGAVIALDPQDPWARGGLLVGGGVVLLYGVIASMIQSHSSYRRRGALLVLYSARSELASHRWWRRSSK